MLLEAHRCQFWWLGDEHIFNECFKNSVSYFNDCREERRIFQCMILGASLGCRYKAESWTSLFQHTCVPSKFNSLAIKCPDAGELVFASTPLKRKLETNIFVPHLALHSQTRTGQRGFFPRIYTCRAWETIWGVPGHRNCAPQPCP